MVHERDARNGGPDQSVRRKRNVRGSPGRRDVADMSRTMTTTASESSSGIRSLRQTLGARSSVARARRLLQRMQWPLAILALLVVPALILDDRAVTSES